MKFIDVFFYEKDLLQSEIKAYQDDYAILIKEEAKKHEFIYKKFPYSCPICEQESPINQYDGNILQARCPKCQHTFKPEPIGDYLISWLYEKDI